MKEIVERRARGLEAPDLDPSASTGRTESGRFLTVARTGAARRPRMIETQRTTSDPILAGTFGLASAKESGDFHERLEHVDREAEAECAGRKQ
jgi:hypothetical protein